jgi:hypothetical protein
MSRKPKQQVFASDRERLELFVSECHRLNEHKHIESGFRASLSIRAEADEPWQYTVLEPDAEILESYLIRLRRFMSEGEPIFVHAVRNVVRRNLIDAELLEELDREVEDWKRLMKSDGIVTTLNGEDISPDLAWDLYINGEYFHFNMEKRRKLEQHSAPHKIWMFRYRFLCQVEYATSHVFAVGEIIHRGLQTNAFDFGEGV